MMTISVDLLTVAKKVNNYDVDATAGGLWTSTTTYQATCPAGKRWFLIGGVVSNSASGTTLAQVHDAADAVIHQLAVIAASTGVKPYPNQNSSADHMQIPTPIVMDAGEYVLVTCGVAQGAGAFASCVVLEVDV